MGVSLLRQPGDKAVTGSALTFLAGGLLTCAIAFNWIIAFLIPFAAGNFLYIGASDQVPEMRRHKDLHVNMINFTAFLIGVSLMLLIRILPGSSKQTACR